MASLSLSNAEIKQSIGLIAGVSRDPDQWDGDFTSDVELIIRSGRRKFFAAHNWTFLTHNFAVNVVAPYDTGTITVVDGVVTIAGGTWPSNSAGQRLAFGDSVYLVSTRDSGSQLTLVDTTIDADALTTFSLYSTRYDLPSNFSEFVGPVTIEGMDGGCWPVQETAILPEFEIRKLLSRASAYTTRPALFSVTRTIASSEIGLPTYLMELYPLPDAAYTLQAMVRINPGDTLSETDATETVHSNFAELMRLAILSAAEYTYNDKPGAFTQEFNEQLPNYIRKDKLSGGARRLLPRGDMRGHADPMYQLRVASVVIE